MPRRSGTLRAVTVPVRENLIRAVEELGIDVPRVVEAALVKAAEERWLVENAEAIRAYNARVEEHGMLLQPLWMDDADGTA